jgi:hypothetical protein
LPLEDRSFHRSRARGVKYGGKRTLCKGQCRACRGPPDSGGADSERASEQRSRRQRGRAGAQREREQPVRERIGGAHRVTGRPVGRRRQSPFPCSSFDPTLLGFGSTGASWSQIRGGGVTAAAGQDGAASSPGRPVGGGDGGAAQAGSWSRIRGGAARATAAWDGAPATRRRWGRVVSRTPSRRVCL